MSTLPSLTSFIYHPLRWLDGTTKAQRTNAAPENPNGARWLTRCAVSGQRGIRTLETLVRFTRSPGVRLKPLGHLSLHLQLQGIGAKAGAV